MPPDFPAWLLLAVLAASIVWTMPKLLGFFIDAIAEAVVNRLENKLAPRWMADLDDALESIQFELTTNGGTSVKDKVNATALAVSEIQQAIEPLVLAHQHRFDPPEGTPL